MWASRSVTDPAAIKTPEQTATTGKNLFDAAIGANFKVGRSADDAKWPIKGEEDSEIACSAFKVIGLPSEQQKVSNDWLTRQLVRFENAV